MPRAAVLPEPRPHSVQRPFGRGRPVSLFTLGTMRALASPEALESVLLAALAAGINHIETAPAYGPAEVFLGRALAHLGERDPDSRAALVITSKLLPGNGEGISCAEGLQQLRRSLSHLGLARLDNLAIHGLNTAEHLRWALHGPGAELLEAALAEGLVDQVGFSSHGATPLIAAALESGRFGFCSLHVHLLDRERLPLAHTALRAGMGVMAISPADKGGRLFEPSEPLLQACAPFSPLQLAYRFLLSEGISTLTLGAAIASDLALAGQLRSADRPLSDDEQSSLRRLEEMLQQRLGSELCGQCRACLPCPSAVPIPAILRLRNLALGLGMETFAKERYNLIGRAGHWWEAVDAGSCRRCGDCLPRCPHGLAIPDLLADSHRRLAAAPRRRLWG